MVKFVVHKKKKKKKKKKKQQQQQQQQQHTCKGSFAVAGNVKGNVIMYGMHDIMHNGLCIIHNTLSWELKS